MKGSRCWELTDGLRQLYEFKTLIIKSCYSDIRVISVLNLPQSISSWTKKVVLTDYQRNKRKMMQEQYEKANEISEQIDSICSVLNDLNKALSINVVF